MINPKIPQWAQALNADAKAEEASVLFNQFVLLLEAHDGSPKAKQLEHALVEADKLFALADYNACELMDRWNPVEDDDNDDDNEW